jgi:hypothetical protein
MDTDPQLRRVTFDLPKEKVPELMAYLGNFATEQDMDIRFSDSDPDVAEPAVTVEQPEYNPALVTWIKDPVSLSDEDIAVITRAHLQDFALERDGHTMAGSKLYNALRAGPNWESRSSYRTTWNSMITYDEDEEFVIRADQAKDLLAALDPKRRELRFRGIREGLVGFFAAFCDELHAELSFD